MWFLELCQAIKYIHLKKILHRDIKTQNVFLDENKTIKLGDFGISKALDNTTDFAQTSIGTPYFLPPEIWRGEKYNNKADIWMIGCVLYELCSLNKPFIGDNIVILMQNIVNDPVPEIPKEYSDELRVIVKLLTNKDDNKRPFIREILEHDIITIKMKELGIFEIESPLISSKKCETNASVFNIKPISTIQSDCNLTDTQNTNVLQNNSSLGILNSNPSSTVSGAQGFGLSKNSSQPELLVAENENQGGRMRKKLRVPEKINKKYDSMGHQAFGKVIEEMNLNNFDGVNSK